MFGLNCYKGYLIWVVKTILGFKFQAGNRCLQIVGSSLYSNFMRAIEFEALMKKSPFVNR